jgi:membrane protease YdiL (CAAX protease family)
MRRPRFARFTIVRIVLATLFVAAPVVALQLVGQALALDGSLLGPTVILAALAGYVAYVRLIEARSPIAELAARGAATQIAVGFALGALLFATTMLVLSLLGAASFGPGEGWGIIAPGLLVAFGAAVAEEIFLRGVVFRIVSERLGDAVALAISAALFGAIHAGNQGATVFSCIAIALEAGVLLAAAFMVTRRLWLPIGLHAAWNFTEGTVFGASVSGTRPRGLLTSRFHGSDLVTGGSFGPEASIVAVVVCLVAATALLVIAARRPRRAA